MRHKLFAFALYSLIVGCASATGDEIEKLIDDLTQISEPGVGYSSTFSGSNFLPYDDAEQLGSFVFGGTYRADSETLREIVSKGADALPVLLNHLSDDRNIDLEPVRGMMWIEFSDEYDYNDRTQTEVPAGVNRDAFGGNENHPDSHAITIGDLCFVAIGQIVNRNFAVTRYQPTGGVIVSSPTHSKALRDVLIADWSGLTAEQHRRLLVDDFEKPDHEYRRIGAYWRLSFYYPDTVEPLVLRTLEQPTFEVFKISRFCRDTLYRAKPEERRQLYDKFLRENGGHYDVGVMDQLFGDLELLEAHEESRFSPPLTMFDTQPRELLIELFDMPDSVTSSDRPQVTVISGSERARFIGSLTHDRSKRIGEVVKQIYLEHADDDYLAPACLRCLANRGYDQFLIQQLNRIDYSARDVNYLHSQCLKAIATSKSHAVRQRLLQVIHETANDTYFIHALSGLPDVDDTVVWDNATRILNELPDDTNAGRSVLELIKMRFPDKAEETFRSFLTTGSAQRAETICVVLWHDHPLAPEILAPLLDDTRELNGFNVPMRVCDRAAQAISHTTDEIEFDSDWYQAKRDAAIARLKEYCERRR